MRFLRTGEAVPDVDFWTWWADARPRIETALNARSFDRTLVDEVSRAVKAMDPRLAWELSEGREAEHAFVVTPDGDPMVRPAALAWLASAPAPDATWEFHAARLPSEESGGLEIGGRRFDFDDMRAIASWDDVRQRADIGLWHPAWPEVDEPMRQQVGFLYLGDLLGEDDLERWIGNLEILDAPSGGLDRAELRAFVRRHAASGPEDTWVVVERTDPRGQVDIVIANAALKRIDHPFRDQHVLVTVELDGMPDEALAASLDAEEDRLVAALDGEAVLAGRSTGAFRREIHLVAEDPSKVRAAIGDWQQSLPNRRIASQIEHDPGWTFQQSLGVG